jgi:hypothetical protein
MSDEHNWFSDRTKTIMVTVTMTILIGGMLWGYIAAQQWKAEREAEKRWVEQNEQMERLLEAEREAAEDGS